MVQCPYFLADQDPVLAQVSTCQG